MIVYELIIRLRYNKCRKGYIWCIGGDFISPSKFKESGKIPYGYALNDNKVARLNKSVLTYSWSKAEPYCIGCSNGDKHGYLPDSDELKSLYDSIMKGKMKTDLTEAGIYKCNYRMEGSSPDCNSYHWCWIWSSDEDSSDYAWYVGYNGNSKSDSKITGNFVIPFFKF